jgi:hypothetical protein
MSYHARMDSIPYDGRMMGDGGNTMAKVFGIHEVRLRPEVSEADFERFINERYTPAWGKIGWKIYLLKGFRGDRPSKYTVLFEIDSMETLVRYEPAIGTWTKEGQAFLKEVAGLLEEWGQYVGGSMFTDYAEVVK